MRTRNLFDPGYGMEKNGYGINIPDSQHLNAYQDTALLADPGVNFYKNADSDPHPSDQICITVIQISMTPL
jgi:hypothetical protein